MDSLAFLQRPDKGKPQAIYVLHGDENFLKRQVLAALQARLLGPEDGGFGLATFAGDKTSFSAVHNELTTLPFLSGRRLVFVENADPFVTSERDKLEKYAAGPSATGVLILDVTTWTSSTRLAKQLPDAVITCKVPTAAPLVEWCQKWAVAQHGKQVAAPAARLLVELVGPDMGLLDQELAKLALYVGAAGQIEQADVDRLVGHSREESTWKLFDLLGSGQMPAAVAYLDRLLEQGEEPIRLLYAFSMQLRRLAQAARLSSQGTPLNQALQEAGVPPFAHRATEQHMRFLGRRRLDRLYDWLLETDLGLKGSSHLPERVVLERLVIQLARPLAPVSAGPSRPTSLRDSMASPRAPSS